MTDRFDFEQKIMNAWGVVDDLDLLLDKIANLEAVHPTVQDELANIVLGLKSVSQMRFEDLFRTFEEMVADGKIA